MKILSPLNKYFSAYQIATQENLYSKLEDGDLKYYKFFRKNCHIEICLLGNTTWHIADPYTKYFILLQASSAIPACLLLQELKKDFETQIKNRSFLDEVLSDLMLL
jgi:hypothetical protein